MARFINQVCEKKIVPQETANRRVKEEKDEQLFSVAFKEMASTIQSFLDNGRAYDMSSLLTMYQDI